MVDINLEAVDASSLPQDLYLSLRVGDSQKFAKASHARNYKFATAGERRHAKLELYRRVGVTSFSIDSGKLQGTHELTLPVDDSRIAGGQVAYRLKLDGAVPEAHQAPAPAPAPAVTEEKTKSINDKVAQAKEYLAKHQLEQRLAEAMQAVLRERPEDPAAFIAQRLNSGAGMMKKVEEPAPAVVEEKPAATPAPVETAPPAATRAPAVVTKNPLPLPKPSAAYPLPTPKVDYPFPPMTLMVTNGMMHFASIGRPAVMIF